MEYLGIRFAMLDAIQRYHTDQEPSLSSPDQKITNLKKHIVAAASDNKLLGAQATTIGAAWARLIDSKPPEDVISFVEHPAIRKMTDSLPVLSERAPDMGLPETISYIAHNLSSLKPLVFSFENLAQDTGLINYKGGESLSGQIAHFSKEICAEQGISTPAPEPVAPGTNDIIKLIFDSHNGPVNPAHLPPTNENNLLSNFLGNVLAGLVSVSDVGANKDHNLPVTPAEIRQWQDRPQQIPGSRPEFKK